MHTAPIGIVGASGYAGLEATRLLAGHEQVELRFVTSERWEGETVGAHTPLMGPAAALRYAPITRTLALAAGCEAVLLATPAAVSLELAPRLLEQGVRVIDLSGAFRLGEAALYPAHYGFAHTHPELLSEAVYGLPEVAPARIASARLIANPGCYPTAATLALWPLLRAGLLDEGSVIVDAASGATGAGRQGTEGFSFCEVEGDFRAYKVLGHQHAPEIARFCAGAAGRFVPLTFTAHLLPTRRGILATCYARLEKAARPEDVAAAYADAYSCSPFIALASAPEMVSLKNVVGTNRCQLGFACDSSGADPGRIVIVSAIDNLLKGAAGQAVQNLNLALGWAQTAGLDRLGGFHP